MSASPVPPSFDPESPVFRAHEGGKLGVHATQPLRDRADLSLLYTPGVADVSLAVAADPALASRYTARGNTVAVVSDGTAEASVTAGTRVTALVLPAAELQDLITAHPPIRNHLAALSDARRAQVEAVRSSNSLGLRSVRRV